MTKSNSKSKIKFASAPRIAKSIMKKGRLSKTSPKDELKYWLGKTSR